MRSIELAEYLVMIGDGATVLCGRHKDALAQAFAAAGQPLEVFSIQEDDETGQPMEPISCQACHMAAVKESTLQ
jgi:hypothetical protein